MKKTIQTLAALILVTLASQAQASSRSTICSSADGHVKVTRNMVANEIQLTELSWNQSGENRRELIYDSLDLSVQESEQKQMFRNDHKYCDPKNKTGSWMHKSIVALKIIITKEDGGLFSKETSGVSDDLKSVEAHIICESVSSGIAPCQ